MVPGSHTGSSCHSTVPAHFLCPAVSSMSRDRALLASLGLVIGSLCSNQPCDRDLSATKEQEEETVYEEVKVKEEHQGDKSDSEGLLTDTTGSRLRHYQQLTCCLTTSCVILLFGIIAVVVHQSKITNLTAEKQNLTSQITQLETDKKTLTEQIREMEEEQLRLNVSRAQWTINAYCPSQSNSDWRRCQGCVPGWLRDESSCYVIIDGFQESRTWDEAQEFCRQRGSHLAVIGNADEKAFITDNSWHGQGISGYWLGLRRQHGRWTWVDGSSLTERIAETRPGWHTFN